METVHFSDSIRYYIVKMLYHLGFGHLGPSLSIADALAVLFNEIMDFNLENKDKINHDWFVLSKGHAGPAYYATLMLKGFFPKEVLDTLIRNNSRYPSHPNRLLTDGVDVSTGSLGQGVSQAVGLAKGLRLRQDSHNVYCLIGDGEFNEGQVFEALTFAVSQKLDNFYVLIDNNKKQLDGFIKDVSLEYNFNNILEALGYDSFEVNGNDTKDISRAFKALNVQNNKPKAIILHTIKGCGIPYFEELVNNHHSRFNAHESKILEDYMKDYEERWGK